MSLARLRRVVERVNEEAPDVVLITGDFVIGGRNHEGGVVGGHFVEPEPIAAELKHLRAPLGVYAVLGNHDWWFDGERVARALEGAGVRVLENHAARIEHAGRSFWLAGVADLWTRTPDVAGTLRQVTTDDPVVLFTHNPDIFPRRPRARQPHARRTHARRAGQPAARRPPRRPLAVRAALRLRPRRRGRPTPLRRRRRRHEHHPRALPRPARDSRPELGGLEVVRPTRLAVTFSAGASETGEVLLRGVCGVGRARGRGGTDGADEPVGEAGEQELTTVPVRARPTERRPTAAMSAFSCT